MSKLKSDIRTYSNELNSMAMFTFFFLDQKYPFWANFVQKLEVTCLN